MAKFRTVKNIEIMRNLIKEVSKLELKSNNHELRMLIYDKRVELIKINMNLGFQLSDLEWKRHKAKLKRDWNKTKEKYNSNRTKFK